MRIELLMQTDSEELGKQLRVYRALRNVSQEQVADMVGVTSKTIGRIETGNFTGITLPVYAKLCHLLLPPVSLPFVTVEEVSRND